MSGEAAIAGNVARGADAYFKYVNDQGGVNGRKITFKYVDDQYNVATTIQLTRQLVEQDHVLAIFNTVTMSVAERRHEFGVLMAVGMRPSAIFRCLLIEVGVVALHGLVAQGGVGECAEQAPRPGSHHAEHDVLVGDVADLGAR